MRRAAPQWTIDSAGTGGWHVGDEPYALMQATTLARGIDISGLRARQFTAADFDRFDLILAMDAQNAADIEAQRPAGNTTAVRLFAENDVPDPYYTRDFAGALEIIEQAAAKLIRDTTAAPSG